MKGILSKVLCIMMSLNGMKVNFITKGFDDLKSTEKRLDAVIAAQNGRNMRGDECHRVWMRMDLLDEFIQNDHILHALTLLKPKVVLHLKDYLTLDPARFVTCLPYRTRLT